MRFVRAQACLLTLGLVWGCGTSREADELDAAVGIDADVVDGVVVGMDGQIIGDEDMPPPIPDGAVPDAPLDGMVDADATIVPDMGRIGTPCRSDDDCDGRFCIEGSGIGYCSWVCAADQPCPDGAQCAFFNGASVGSCLLPCTPAGPGMMDSCLPGFVCSAGFGTPGPVCLSGCADDMDCDPGQRCGPGFVAGVGRCFTPSVAEATPCASNAECSIGQFCLSEAAAGFPGGACLTFGCDQATGSGCSTGFECIPYPFTAGGVCLPGCADSTACRAGYECRPSPRGPSACVPRCATNADCSDGRVCDFLSGYCITTM
ncbi:MAG: hypothetical protein AAGF12_39090 [Myxococcota bacterium]